MFMHFLGVLMCVHYTLALRINEHYYQIKENVKIAEKLQTKKALHGKLSELGCAMKCMSMDSCCMASHKRSTKECALSISSSCEYKIEPENGSVVYVTKVPMPQDCSEITGQSYKSGIYKICPEGTSKGFDVYCEMEKHGGGWTVFQRRMDGSVDFYRNWDSYKHGFGNLNGEFWLENEYLHKITRQTKYKLRIDMKDFENNTRYAEYSTFAVGDEKTSYQLQVGGYEGTANDALSYHNGQKFSTKDKDNPDKINPDSCAQTYKGAWWYKTCHSSNLNGQYLRGKHNTFADGINWNQWKGHHYSLKEVVMMVRREG